MKSTKPLRRQRRGSVLALTPAVIVLLASMTAFAIDLGYLYVAEASLETAAESAAIAGALELRDDEYESVVRASSVQFANLNEPGNGAVLVDNDITLGVWDFTAQSFAATSVEPNAVSVNVRRDGSNTAAVPMFFANIFGINNASVSATAVAAFTVTTDENGVKQKGPATLVQ